MEGEQAQQLCYSSLQTQKTTENVQTPIATPSWISVAVRSLKASWHKDCLWKGNQMKWAGRLHSHKLTTSPHWVITTLHPHQILITAISQYSHHYIVDVQSWRLSRKQVCTVRHTAWPTWSRSFLDLQSSGMRTMYFTSTKNSIHDTNDTHRHHSQLSLTSIASISTGYSHDSAGISTRRFTNQNDHAMERYTQVSRYRKNLH